MSNGQKLWRKAKVIIPGGNMLLSKRSEMFLPENWPSYFSEAHGCYVKDLDGKKYLDMSIMGIGTNTLGYGHPEVDEAVIKNIKLGNMSTFNCPEEVYLAEKLLDMHKWADMAKFARSGGEANAIAIRIARAASGKDKVAICGYHGWHDWYLAANLGEQSQLDGHLLPGLDPLGVPKNLKGSVITFEYNDLNGLAEIIQNNEIGVIKMEVSRNFGPRDGFLEGVRSLASKNGIVLIFDECTSGFRETFGGLHKKFNVEPDMAVFGKALGNGYAISSVIGKRAVMESAQSTFISSTFWTERVGPTAALKTLEIMERDRSWEVITNIGLSIKDHWKEIFSENNLDIQISGIPAIQSFVFKSKDNIKYKTFITQEMLKKSILASTLLFTCISHTDDLIRRYIEELNMILSQIKKFETGESNVDSYLDGPSCHSGFKRLN